MKQTQNTAQLQLQLQQFLQRVCSKIRYHFGTFLPLLEYMSWLTTQSPLASIDYYLDLPMKNRACREAFILRQIRTAATSLTPLVSSISNEEWFNLMS